MKHQLYFGVALAALSFSGAVFAPTAAYAQETTSTIQGTITRGGTPEAGVAVVVTHIPSGTRSATTTSSDGAFTLSGLRVGGPYDVEAGGTKVTDVSLTAGQSFQLPIDLPAEIANDIVVTASRVVSARSISQGPANVLNSDQIAQVASVSRDIRDLMRRDPFATLDTSRGGARVVSFAGQNARFNRFTIDGVPITDGFGLNPDGLPSRRGPVPLDAIEQFQTKIAPYDIRDGFFQGGVTNAVLKSGTNQFHGTAFFSYSSDGLTGEQTKPYITNPTGRVRQFPFKDRDFGAQISGPIIPDKLFFMVAAERVRANRPIDLGTVETNGGTPVLGLSDVTVADIRRIAKDKYNYDSGGVLTGNNDRDDRLVARLDANLSDTQRASATYIYTKDSINTATNTSLTGSNAGLGLASNYYVKPNKVEAGIFQLNSTWSDSFSTETRVLYKKYDSGQFPLLAQGAQFKICSAATSDRPTAPGATTNTTLSGNCPSGVANVYIGAGGPSQYNVLSTKTWGGSFLARLSLNDHNVRAIADYSSVDVYNLFLNGGRGSYYFDSIADFAAGNAQSFSYSNAPSLNPQDAGASFKYQTYTFGIQDDWRVSDILSVSAGMRYDLFGGSSRPAVNSFYLARYGFANNAFISGRGLFQPRFGFDFKPLPRLSFRGGAGIFGAGTPDVYVSNSFANSGVLINSVSANITDGNFYRINSATVTDAQGQALLNNVGISSLPAAANAQIVFNPTTSTASLDPNFRIPSQFRATLSASYRANLGPLGDGWNFGADFFYSRVRDQVSFIDLRSVPIPGSLTPDGRQRYRSAAGLSATDSGNDILLTNTSLGRSYVAVARFDKTFDFGVNIFGSYTWQDVKDASPATSSIASSNYSGAMYEDPNRAAYGPSNDQVKWSFKYGIGFDRAFFGDYHTRFNIFGETRAGSPFSYAFQDSSASRSTTFGTTGTDSRYLFYVPTGLNDPLVTYGDTVANGVVTQTAAVAQATIDSIINNSGLAAYRGKIAPRNAFRSKAFTKIDLHVEQEIPLPFKTRVTLFGDIENFTNLLNNKWGQQLRTQFPLFNKIVTQVRCVASGTNPCAQYQYLTATTSATQLADQLVTTNGSSLYAIRLGVRVSF